MGAVAEEETRQEPIVRGRVPVRPQLGALKDNEQTGRSKKRLWGGGWGGGVGWLFFLFWGGGVGGRLN